MGRAPRTTKKLRQEPGEEGQQQYFSFPAIQSSGIDSALVKPKREAMQIIDD